MRFRDRIDAGRQLAVRLLHYANRDDVLVLALPRGGVPIAYEVAKAIAAPLDVFLVRKLGLPGHEELAVGAIASGGVRVLNDDVVQMYGISPETIDEIAEKEGKELRRREAAYRDDRPPPSIQGQTVILIDDGLATGSTMKAAVQAVRQMNPSAIVVAVPVSAPETCRELAFLADDVVCLFAPRDFLGVGMWYQDFSQTTDDEVGRLLARGPQGLMGRT